MNKVCHFMSEIRPGGGPSGYLYNIYKEKEKKNFDIKFVSISDERMNITKKKEKKYFLKRIIEKTIPYKIIYKYFFKDIFRIKKELFDSNLINELSKYDVIVFHHIKEFYLWTSKFKQNNQKCYLFSHCPTDFTMEYVSTPFRNDWSKKFKTYCLPFIRKKEIEIFKLADGIICPSYYSLDYYFENDEFCRNKFNKLNFIEVISGVVDLTKDDNNNKVNGDYILYLGRYHTAKGFDIYLEASSMANSDKKWLCGGFGKLEEIIPNYPKVKNLGWVKNVTDLIVNAEVIVVPNRSTFFDLIILEALSLSKPIVTTFTGGNKALITSPDILLCEPNPKLIADAVDNIIAKKTNGYSVINREIYDENYSMSKFITRYNILTEQLLA